MMASLALLQSEGENNLTFRVNKYLTSKDTVTTTKGKILLQRYE